MRGDVVSQSGERLKSGQLGTADVTASTVANIGPGIDFYFGFGVVAATAGVAAPLTILAAAVAVALLAFTVAEFTKAEPSAGSFITARGVKLSTVAVGTVRRDLLALAGWLRCWGVSRAGLESTSDYWKPVFFLLEREGLDCVLYQASQVRALPGRPKTDKLDSVWLAKVTERGSLTAVIASERDPRALPRKRRGVIASTVSIELLRGAPSEHYRVDDPVGMLKITGLVRS